MAKQDIPGGTNKSLRTQLLWQLSLLRSCAWRRLLYPSGEGVGVTRSEEQSPTWDFSQPQLEHGTGEGWKPSLPSHPFPFSLTENREGCLHVLPLTVNKPKAPCWTSPMTSSGLCLGLHWDQLSHISMGPVPERQDWKLSTYLLEESTLDKVSRNAFLCQKLCGTRLDRKFLVAMVAACSKSLYYSLLNSSKGE